MRAGACGVAAARARKRTNLPDPRLARPALFPTPLFSCALALHSTPRPFQKGNTHPHTRPLTPFPPKRHTRTHARPSSPSIIARAPLSTHRKGKASKREGKAREGKAPGTHCTPVSSLHSFQGAALAASSACPASCCAACAAAARVCSTAAQAPDCEAAALKEDGISVACAPADSTVRCAKDVTDPNADAAASGAEMVDPVEGLDRERAFEAAARTWAEGVEGKGEGVVRLRGAAAVERESSPFPSPLRAACRRLSALHDRSAWPGGRA